MRSTDKGQTWSTPTQVLAEMPRSDPNPQDQVWWAGVTDPDNGNGISGIGVFHEGGGLYLGPGGIVCLDAFTPGHTKKNKATSGGADIFGSYTTC
jgi:hypothetical protein